MVSTRLIDAPARIPSYYDQVVDLTPLTTDIAPIWRGLQFWLTAASYSGSAPGYSIAGPDASGNYEARLLDRARRLKWTGIAGDERHDATYYNVANNQIFLPTLTSAASGINGRSALSCVRSGDGVRIPAEAARAQNVGAVAAATLADEYTTVIIFSAPAGAVGGIVSTGAAGGAHDNGDLGAGCGMRIGFLTDANGGQMLYQHSAQAEDRITFNRPIVSDAPVLLIHRGRKEGGAYPGSVRVVTGGVTTDHAFSFTRPRFNASFFQPAMHLGSQGTLGDNAGQARKIGLFASWSRSLSDIETDALTAWLKQAAHGGPF